MTTIADRPGLPRRTSIKPANTEEAQVDAVTQSLIRRFEGHVPAEQVSMEVNTARDRLRSARLRRFVPVLIQHAATERLISITSEAALAR